MGYTTHEYLEIHMLGNEKGECLQVITPGGEKLEIPVLSKEEMSEALGMFVSCAPPYSHAHNNYKLMFYFLLTEHFKLKKEFDALKEQPGMGATKERPLAFGALK